MVVDDIWGLLNRIFTADAPLVRSQHVENLRSNKLSIPEVKLWLDILGTTCEDWLMYKNDSSEANRRLVKDIEEWAFKESFTLDRICEAVLIGFQVEAEIFKDKFRIWLEKERAIVSHSFTDFKIDEPFEDYTQRGGSDPSSII